MINWINSNKHFHHKSITWEKSMFGVTSKLLMAYKCSLFSLLILSTKEHVWSLGCLQNEFFFSPCIYNALMSKFRKSFPYVNNRYQKIEFPLHFFYFNVGKKLNFLLVNTKIRKRKNEGQEFLYDQNWVIHKTIWLLTLNSLPTFLN